MLAFLAHLIITAALILVIAKLVSGIEVEGWTSAILAALVLGLANALLRPAMVILTYPLTLLTFGLFLLVINGLVLQIAVWLTPGAKIQGCGAAFVGAFLLTLLNMAIEAVLGPAWPR